MFSKSKWLIVALCLGFLASTTFVGMAEAQKRSSSRSSFSSSKPKYGSGTSVTKPKPKYGTGTTTSKPSATKPKYGAGTSTPPKTGTKPKYGTGTSTPNTTTKPKYGTTSKPSTGNDLSRKPSSTQSNQSRARDQVYSQRKYVETKKATAPPKSKYTTSDGKTVNVRTESSTVKSIRSKPSTYYTPAQRTTRYETVVTHHHYSHPYSWYSSQPHYYVGGGYSSAFWYIMLNEWSAERRARWLYHNQNTIERDAYERGMRDAAVAQELAKLKAENVSVNPDYVDEDFSDNPDLMYSQEYVEAAYNPTVAPSSGGGMVALWIIGIVFVGVVLWFVVFRMKVTS